MTTQRIIQSDCIEGMRTLPDASVHCCVTSPPYWGLRDYGHDGQIGLESTPEAYVARIVKVFREVRRVLRDDGTLWLNLGDSYAANAATSKKVGESHRGSDTPTLNQPHQCRVSVRGGDWSIKAKDLVGIPWRVAFALQADGWWLRQDIIWHKPNPMPESVRDRCTKAHEYVFLLTKSERYYYDAEAVSEPSVHAGETRVTTAKSFAGQAEGKGIKPTGNAKPGSVVAIKDRKNKRSVWRVCGKPYSGAHFAVMPAALVEPCIKAGCPEGGTVLDPFAGSGTTLAVAAELGRNGIGCELNPDYIALAEQRIAKSREKMALFA
jgi:DNA modification methylase